MILLAVDTSCATGSLAVARIKENQVLASHGITWEKRSGHSELATVRLTELLDQTQLNLRHLTHLVVNLGPGSFTGIRVGLSLVKSLAYALNLPLLGLNSLENSAFENGSPGESVFIAHKAVQNFFYCARYDRHEKGLTTVMAPRSADGSELATLQVGCTKVLIEGVTAGYLPRSHAVGLVNQVVNSNPSVEFLDWKIVEPLYIRGSEAEEKLKRGILKPLS